MLRFLVSKLRSGEIRREHVELAAQLGHPWAQKIVGPVPIIDFTTREDRIKFFDSLKQIDGNCYFIVKLACILAEHILPRFENVFRHELRPRQAILAARQWANTPTEENRLLALNLSNTVLEIVHLIEGDPLNYEHDMWPSTAARLASDVAFMAGTVEYVGDVGYENVGYHMSRFVSVGGGAGGVANETVDESLRLQASIVADVLMGFREAKN